MKVKSACVYFVSVLLILISVAYFSARDHKQLAIDRPAIAREIQSLGQRVRNDKRDSESLLKIIEYLDNSSPFIQTYACVELRDLGPLARPATADLIRKLNCGEPAVEREAARALGEVSTGMDLAVSALITKMRSNDSVDSSWFAAESLGNIGVPASGAIPDLEIAAKASNENMRYYASTAISRLTKASEHEKAHGSD